MNAVAAGLKRVLAYENLEFSSAKYLGSCFSASQIAPKEYINCEMLCVNMLLVDATLR